MNLPLARDGGQRRGRDGRQPSRFSGSSIAVDHIAETVPTPTVTFIGTYASCRFCTGQINSQRGIAKCSVARVRYPVERRA